jgi:hypothetical protein
MATSTEDIINYVLFATFEVAHAGLIAMYKQQGMV